MVFFIANISDYLNIHSIELQNTITSFLVFPCWMINNIITNAAFAWAHCITRAIVSPTSPHVVHLAIKTGVQLLNYGSLREILYFYASDINCRNVHFLCAAIKRYSDCTQKIRNSEYSLLKFICLKMWWNNLHQN